MNKEICRKCCNEYNTDEEIWGCQDVKLFDHHWDTYKIVDCPASNNISGIKINEQVPDKCFYSLEQMMINEV